MHITIHTKHVLIKYDFHSKLKKNNICNRSFNHYDFGSFLLLKSISRFISAIIDDLLLYRCLELCLLLNIDFLISYISRVLIL